MENANPLLNQSDRRILIAPSILGADFAKLGDIANRLKEAGADLLHIDVMDGAFVPNISIGACVIRSLAAHIDLPLDVHMMVQNPERYIRDMAEAGASCITVHAEATPHIHRALQMIRAFPSVAAGVAINPGTPVESLSCVLQEADMVLIMTVNPGFGGQKLIPSTLAKIKDARRMLDAIGSRARIEVDGGVCPENVNEFTRRGADVLVCGASVVGAEDYRVAIQGIRGGFEAG
jgi:ribulose-phosphate 3-epimerase